jgi:hypothetical protein
MAPVPDKKINAAAAPNLSDNMSKQLKWKIQPSVLSFFLLFLLLKMCYKSAMLQNALLTITFRNMLVTT